MGALVSTPIAFMKRRLSSTCECICWTSVSHIEAVCDNLLSVIYGIPSMTFLCSDFLLVDSQRSPSSRHVGGKYRHIRLHCRMCVDQIVVTRIGGFSLMMVPECHAMIHTHHACPNAAQIAYVDKRIRPLSPTCRECPQNVQSLCGLMISGHHSLRIMRS